MRQGGGGGGQRASDRDRPRESAVWERLGVVKSVPNRFVGQWYIFFSVATTTPSIALIPIDVLPAATAFNAYSICTSFPEGLCERGCAEKIGQRRCVGCVSANMGQPRR